MTFGAVHGEPGVIVALVGGRDGGGCGLHFGGRIWVVDMARRDVGERDGAQHLDRGRTNVIAGPADVVVGDLRDEHHPAWRRGGVAGQQA